jgi:hypothetical protein
VDDRLRVRADDLECVRRGAWYEKARPAIQQEGRPDDILRWLIDEARALLGSPELPADVFTRPGAP